MIRRTARSLALLWKTALLSLLFCNVVFGQTAKEEYVDFVPAGKHFSVQVPSDWQKDESLFLNEYGEYGVTLRAPGREGLEYVLIKIACFAERHRTPEKFVFEKLNPGFLRQNREVSPVNEITVAGLKAKTFEIRAPRLPIAGIGDKAVDALERYVVVPAEAGFFILSFNTPVQVEKKYRPTFEKVVDSFRPLIPSTTEKEDEVSDIEYEVYADFFKTTKAPKVDSPVPFTFPSTGSLVHEMTTAGEKITGEPLIKSLSGADPSVIESYNRRNDKEYRLKDKILVSRIKILTKDKSDEIKGKKGFGRGFAQGVRDSYPLEGGVVINLSRIGINRDMNEALFRAGSSDGQLGGSYFILMEKTGDAWRLKKAVLIKSWYH